MNLSKIHSSKCIYFIFFKRKLLNGAADMMYLELRTISVLSHQFSEFSQRSHVCIMLFPQVLLHNCLGETLLRIHCQTGRAFQGVGLHF